MTITIDTLTSADPATGTAIRTPDQRLRVFVSSTMGELAPEREAVRTAVRSLRLNPVMFELGARPHAPRDLYRSYLAQSDIFIGIYWQSYGWTAPEMDVSGLHDEYLLSEGRPRLIYVKRPAPDIQPELESLLDDVRASGDISYKSFESPGELAELVLDDLAVLLSERFTAAGGRSLPSGTLTFMVTDVEDSTRIVEEFGGAYGDVLGRFHRIVDGSVTARDGTVVDRDGDRISSVFPDPMRAVEAAVEVQRSLGLGPLAPGIDLKARIGLHTGQATPTGVGYVGIDAHRAMRIAAAGHGGQIVLSSVTHGLVADDLAPLGWSGRDLGTYTLKGLSRAERLYQLTVPGLIPTFAEPRARRAVAARLPLQLTSLVDRHEEVESLATILGRSDTRLVTLTGTGGIGKTRLGLAVAERVADGYPDGVFFVSLSALMDARQVTTAIADELHVTVGSSALESLADALAHKQVLLLLDNFEQVVSAAADVVALLERCPGLNVLVTSRVALRVHGEHEYPVGPLPFPGPDERGDINTFPAVQLFEERARAVRPDFEVSVDNAAHVAAIVRRLDGLPLAIELAAARLRMLTPAALAELLARSFDVLGHGPQGLPARQRTLRSTIDWSYALLTAEEKQVFRRVAVLADGWTLDAATAVAGPEAAWVVESLVDKSLLRVEPDGSGVSRFRMLVTVRDFARDQLEGSGEAEEMHRRHGSYYASLAMGVGAGLTDTRQAATMSTLDLEWENLRDAADWLVAAADHETVVQMSHAIWVYLWLRGHVAEALRWLEGVADLSGDMANGWRGVMLWLRGGALYEMGEYQKAVAVLDESIRLVSAAGDDDSETWARFLRASALPAFDVDDVELEIELEEILARFQRASNPWGEAWVRSNLAMLAGSRGDLDSALEHVTESGRLAEVMGNSALAALATSSIGQVRLAMGDVAEGRASLSRSLEMHRTVSYREGLTYLLDGLASLAIAEGDGHRSMTAVGAAESLRERLGYRPWPALRWYSEPMRQLVDAVPDPEMQAARAAGREMDPMAAAQLALGS